jgi:capsular polysaccharide transport system permease protein
LNMVIDETTGITKIAFDSTDPELAIGVLRFLLTEGEAFLNELNHKRAQIKITFFTSQLESSKKNLDVANDALERFQNRYRTVDPSTTVALNESIIANIETEVVRKTAEYNQLITYMSPKNIDAVKLKSEIKELQSAVEKIKNRLSGDEKELLNDLLFEFQKLKNDAEFATEIYKNTLVQFESNRIEALQNSKIFEVIAEPQLPDGHIYPKRTRMILTAIIVVFILYKSAMMLWAIVQDHKD